MFFTIFQRQNAQLLLSESYCGYILISYSHKVFFPCQVKITSDICRGARFNIEEEIRLELLKQEIKEVDSEDDDPTLYNYGTDNDESSVGIGNEKECGDPFQPDSNTEDKEKSFVMGKDGETIWTTSNFRKRSSRTSQRNIVIHFPDA